MADNVQLSTNIGTGDKAVTASITWSGDTAQLQGVFPAIITGSEGAWSMSQIVGGAGAVSAGTQRMTLASDDPAVVSLQLLDNAISGAGFNITQFGGAAVPIGSGVEATALRVTLSSNTTVPLPTGAATAAKQPALGTAGSASADVITIQGIASGTVVPVSDGGGSITIDGTVSVSGLVPGTTATSLGKAEDSVAGDGDTGVMALVVRKDVAATSVGADGDYSPLIVDADGLLWTRIGASIPAGTNAIGKLAANSGVDIGDVDVLTLPAITIAAAQTLATVTTVTTVGAVTAITNALPAGTNAIGKLAANSGVDIGDVDVTSISAGSNLIGDVGLQPRTSGGLTMSKTTSAASTNATSLKASAGQVYAVQVFNVNAAVRYLKFYNKASAPTVGTDTPVKTLAIPGNTAGAGMVLAWPQGLAFGTGIAFALTTEATDAGTTGVAANEITVNIDYK